MADHIHALRRGLDSVEAALKKAEIERRKVPNNQLGMPDHLYDVSQMYSAIGRRLGLTGLEGEFHALKTAINKLAKEALDDSRDWQANLQGRSRSRSRTRRSRSVA
jgi:hypothetical protein